MTNWTDRPVLVTRATGMHVGWLVDALLALDAQVVALVRDHAPSCRVAEGIRTRVDSARGDVADQALIERILAGYEVRTVFHLAAQTIVPVADRNPVSTFESNIRGTCSVLEACRHSPTVSEIAMASSDKAYAARNYLPFREDTPLGGRSPYDVSKSCVDLIAKSYAYSHGLPVVVTRCRNFVDGDLNWSRLVPGAIRDLIAERSPVIRSDAKMIRDYLYIEEGAGASVLTAEALMYRRDLAGRAFNFLSEQPLTVLGILARISATVGTRITPTVPGTAVTEIPAQHLDATATRGRVRLAPRDRPGRWATPHRPLVPPPPGAAHSGTMTFTLADACRSCAGTPLTPIFDLGNQPLANAYPQPVDTGPEQRYPLGLVLCGRCALVQLTGSVDPRVMFDDYLYFTSYSATMVGAMRELADRVSAERALGPSALVVDIGSNDGYLLRHYRVLGVRVLGVDPAANVAATAVEAGIHTLVAYFGTAAAKQVRAEHGPADVIHANNVMAHVPDVNDFTAGLEHLLGDAGVVVVESPYVADLVSGCAFDTVYHEHVFYYSMTSMAAVLHRHGLAVTDVEHLPVHGGTLRYTIRRAPASGSLAVQQLLDREAAAGIAGPGYYRALDERVGRVRARVLALLTDVRARGGRIAAYGAAAKGTVLLNHFGITTGLIDAVVDRNPHKQGRLMPGTRIPIVDPGYLSAVRPTHVVLLAWNLLEEVVQQQADYLRDGGCFIVPLPEPRIIRR